MKIAEFFAGSRSFTKVAQKLGHETFCTDVEPFEGIDLVCDILAFDVKQLPWQPDLAWFSPPCQTFSVASISTYYTGGKGAYTPKKAETYIGMAMVQKAIDIIKIVQPRYWYIENPRGVLRKLDVAKQLPVRHTVWFCQYGDQRAKPTDIWTNINNPWVPRPVCKNGNKDCHHQPAPRGSRTGTQGLKGAYQRSMVPAGLCEDIIKTHEKDFN